MKQILNYAQLILVFQIISSGILFSNTVKYISPVPSSINNMEKTNIIIGFSERLYISSINTEQIKVTGSLSGVHKGKLIFVENDTKILFNPDIPFVLGEKVTVSGINDVDDFSFYVRSSIASSQDVKLVNSPVSELKNIPFQKDFLFSPDSLPAFTIYNSGNTANGYLFISNFGSGFFYSILMMLNNNGTPNFARTLQYRAFDFKRQGNLLTYFYEGKQFFLGMNSSYNVVDSFLCRNGYTTNFHECKVTPDGSAFVICYDIQTVDMSVVVPGGKTNAQVTGLIIQKIDQNKNVVFQWRSWDHFQITDATHENLTAYSIDYVHGNSIEVESDGNIMLSSRHMDEITKISTETGDIIWRLGGRNNEFQFINDTLGFSHQHSINRLENGNILLFDNGNFHSPQFSRAVEYNLDENAKTAQLVWEYRHDPSIYASAMGSVQRLSNGNTLIGWGSAPTTLTEVTPDGTIMYELSLPSGQTSYRAFRFEWGTMTGSSVINNIVPNKYKLYQNYPNPFNPTTNIKYEIPKDGYVTLKIYDMTGREIATMINDYQNAGIHEIQFSNESGVMNKLSSGIYFYKIQTGSFVDIKKMVLIK